MKKLILVLALLCCSPALAQECGDVNENGEVTAADALGVLQSAVGLGALSCRTGDFVALEDRVAALEAGPVTKTVFATSDTYTGNLGGLAGGDAICNFHAAAGGLTGTFMAWLGDVTGSPATRFTKSPGPYVLVNGLVVAENWDDLIDGLLERPIVENEYGQHLYPPQFTSFLRVWTGTYGNGVSEPDSCQNWSTDGPGSGNSGIIGIYLGMRLYGWSDYDQVACNNSYPLYCFEQ